jgi:hypothetical protein
MLPFGGNCVLEFIRSVEQDLCCQSKWLDQGFVVLNAFFLEDYMHVCYQDWKNDL